MAPAAIATPSLLYGAGWLFWAPYATAGPTNTVTGGVFTDSWPVAFLPLGATVEGSTFHYETQVAAMNVAEFFDPVAYATTGRLGSFAFAMASWNLTNLKRALNGGAITTTGTGATTLNTYTLPTPGQEVRSVIGWESQASDVRVVVNQALSSGTIESLFKKAPDFAQIPTTWNMEVPAGGQPFSIATAGTVRG